LHRFNHKIFFYGIESANMDVPPTRNCAILTNGRSALTSGIHDNKLNPNFAIIIRPKKRGVTLVNKIQGLYL